MPRIKSKVPKTPKPTESPPATLKPSAPSLNDPGPKPELKWIALADLFIDHSCQRTTRSDRSQDNLRYIREHFSWAHCGALIVCRASTKNRYAVVDGQHRLEAAKARGDITTMPCLVIENHDFKKQALAFGVVNARRVTLTSLAKFHAAVAAGDSDAVSIKEICDECKIEILRAPVPLGEMEPRQFQSVRTMNQLIRQYSRGQLTWALTIVPDAYGDEPGQLRAQFVKALAAFRKANPESDRAQMIKVLADVDPEQLQDDSRAVARSQGGSSVAAAVGILERLYRNAGRKNAA